MLAKHEELELWGLTYEFGRGLCDSFKAYEESMRRYKANEHNREDLYRVMQCLSKVKDSIKAIDDLYHVLSCLAAKEFWKTCYPEVNWQEVDVLAKGTNAPGPDIHIPEAKIVGEVETTEIPLSRGLSGRTGKLEEDFERLSSAQWNGYKRYMFVRDAQIFAKCETDYAKKYPKVCFVLLRNASQQDVLGNCVS